MTELATILQTLSQLKPELIEKFHVRSLGLFGSIVRNDFGKMSEVDIIVDFETQIGIGFVDLADYLEKKIQKNIDLVSRNGIKQKYFQSIEREIIYV